MNSACITSWSTFYRNHSTNWPCPFLFPHPRKLGLGPPQFPKCFLSPKCRLERSTYTSLDSWQLFWLHSPLAMPCWTSECPDVKNCKWLLNPVWQRMFYSCAHMATVAVKGLYILFNPKFHLNFQFLLMCTKITHDILIMPERIKYCLIVYWNIKRETPLTYRWLF